MVGLLVCSSVTVWVLCVVLIRAKSVCCCGASCIWVGVSVGSYVSVRLCVCVEMWVLFWVCVCDEWYV